jgi:ornithine carbamoyltransferase
MHFLSLKDFSKEEIIFLIENARQIKANPYRYKSALSGKTLLMLFAKPSLRTRLSFEAGMTQLGGHAIYYDVSSSPLGKGKETIQDTGRTASQYVDIIMARLFAHKELEELASVSSVPVINGLTDFSHPCQVMADLMTIWEKKGNFKGLKLAYVGDGNNNVTHSLLFSCPKLGMEIAVGSPKGLEPNPDVIKSAKKFAKDCGGKVLLVKTAEKAVNGADIVVTDSWMSYHIPKEKEKERIEILRKYQVNKNAFSIAKKDAIFMHCLPAIRGQEVTSEVIDGPQSVVFEEAGNRLYIQKAILLWLVEKL